MSKVSSPPELAYLRKTTRAVKLTPRTKVTYVLCDSKH